MENKKLKFSIEYIDENGEKVYQDHEISVEDYQMESIDELEQILLKEGKMNMRKFISEQLTQVSKKNSNQKPE